MTVYESAGDKSTYKYTGQELDAGTGLYYYHARTYDPMLARFLQPGCNSLKRSCKSYPSRRADRLFREAGAAYLKQVEEFNRHPVIQQAVAVRKRGNKGASMKKSRPE